MKPIVLLGEAYGANEARTKTAFVGASGVELLRMLDQSHIITLSAEDHSFIQRFWTEGQPALIDMIWRMHPHVHRTNVFNFHPPSNEIAWVCGSKAEGIIGYPALTKSKYVRREFIPELERLADELLSLNPNLIIALGNTPLWALAGRTGIAKLRGTTCLSTHTAAGFKVLPTYHPAAVLRQWELRPTVIMDLCKAAREAQFPEIRRPEREIWIEPTLTDLEDFYTRYIRVSPRLAVDIETIGNQITCIGVSPSKEISLVIPFWDTRTKDGSYWRTKTDEARAWAFVKAILEDRNIRKVFQNGLYDIAFLLRSVGIKVYGADHDTMLLSHSQQPESLKGLGFLGSVFTDESAWKTERRGTTIKRDA